MTKNGWERGEAPDFWMEEDPPSGLYDYYIFDHADELTVHRSLVLHLLRKLGLIEYGTIYETVDCIRIRVKDA